MILLIYHADLDKMSCNSILKLFRDLKNFYENVIVYKINYTNYHKTIMKYLFDIKTITFKYKIKLIFTVWTFLNNTKSHNLTTYISKLNLNIPIICHVHDCFPAVCSTFINFLKNRIWFYEIGNREQINKFISSNKIFFLNHCATKNFIKDFNINPINKVLLSGGIDKNIYPDRFFLSEKFTKKIPSKMDEKNHPGYFILDENYPNLLNSYIACIYTSIYIETLEDNKYVLAKAFEIPATGSLLLAHENCCSSLEIIGFKNNHSFLTFNNENFEEKVDYILDFNNRPFIDNIRKNGQNFVLENHTEDNRKKEIINTLNSIIT